MNIRTIIHLIVYPLLLSLIYQYTFAQYPDDQVAGQLNTLFDEMYGLDQKLIRGAQYYDKYPGSQGNEFLGSDDFARGRLVINGVEYNHVDIRYDIYNQQVNLQFRNHSSAVNAVVLNNDNIEEFELNGMVFRKYFFPETGTSFFQIIAEGRITCLSFWYKNLSHRTSVDYVYEFSDSRKKSFLLIDTILYKYSWKQTFIKLFPENMPGLRKYINQNNIRLRKASDSTMKKLIEYCDSLSNPESEE